MIFALIVNLEELRQGRTKLRQDFVHSQSVFTQMILPVNQGFIVSNRSIL